MHLGWWSAFVETITRSDVPGYTKGPWMVRQMMPAVLADHGGCRRGGCCRRSMPGCDERAIRDWKIGLLPDSLRIWAVAVFVCVVMLTVCASGRIGSRLRSGWRDYGYRLWDRCCCVSGQEGRLSGDLMMLTGAAGAAAVVFQGRFFLYHFHPLVAYASYLGRRGDRRGVFAGQCM